MFNKLVVVLLLCLFSSLACADKTDAESAGFTITPDMRAAMNAPGIETPKAWLGNAIQYHYQSDPLSIDVGRKYRLPEARKKCAAGDRDSCATATAIQKWLAWAKTVPQSKAVECDRSPCARIADDLIPAALKGKSWVLHAWASWCPYCRMDHERLAALGPHEKARLVSLLYQDTEKPAAEFLAVHGNPYAGGTIGSTHAGRALLDDLDLRKVPVTYLIGADGNVVQRFQGTLGSEAQDAVARHLRNP